MRKYQLKKYQTEEILLNGRPVKVLKGRPKSLNQALAGTVARYPERQALIAGPRRLTFAELDEFSDRIAGALRRDFGVKAGDRVALLMGVDVDYPLCFFALMKLGAVAVPLNTRFKGEELSYEIDNSESSLLILDQEFWPVIESWLPGRKTLRRVIFNGQDIPPGAVPLANLLAPRPRLGDPHQPQEDDTAVIMYTSGTTGHPKGAMQTHLGIIAADMLIDDFLQIDAECDRIICAVPLFHSIGTVMTMMGAVYAGIPCVYMCRFKTEDLLRTIADERITLIIHVPTVVWLMVNHPKFSQYDLSSLRLAFIGGAVKNPEVIAQIRRKLPGMKICEAFGMTETHTMDCLLDDADIGRKIETVGLGVPIEEIKIVDRRGDLCPPGVPGELCLRGPKIIKGYWNNPKATAEAIRDGWLHTGDIAQMDEEGFVSIKDRIKDMIIRGGENIYSVEVEEALYRLDKVLEAAVVGRPDAVMGEEVMAYLVLKPGQSLTPEDVREFCGRHLADFKAPKYVQFVAELPRTPAGKVRKKILREMARDFVPDKKTGGGL